MGVCVHALQKMRGGRERNQETLKKPATRPALRSNLKENEARKMDAEAEWDGVGWGREEGSYLCYEPLLKAGSWGLGQGSNNSLVAGEAPSLGKGLVFQDSGLGQLHKDEAKVVGRSLARKPKF